MMAAARGDRATSIIRQNARYQNDDSNLSRYAEHLEQLLGAVLN